MAEKINWKEEQITDIIIRYKNQETTREIGLIYGCSKSTIRKILKQNHIPLISRRTLNKKSPRDPKKVIDKTGNVYGKLKVIKKGPRKITNEKSLRIGRETYWCECSCGLSCVLIDKRKLREGGTTSCGLCLKRDAKGRFPQKIVFSSEDKINIINAYKNGSSVYELASQYKCSVRPIRDIIVSKIGKGKKEDLRKFSDQEALLLKKEFELNSRMTYVDLQKKFGGSVSSIRSALFRVGVSGRGRGFLVSLETQLSKELCDEIWRKYNENKISAEDLGKEYQMKEGVVLRAIRESGNEPRMPGDTQIAFTQVQEKEINQLYLSGMSANDIAKKFNVTNGTVIRALRRNDIEIRDDQNLENMRMILNREGRYAIEKETQYYVYSKKNFPEYLKPGIKFSDEDRAKHSQGYYDECLLLIVFPSREEAFFIEQAVLNETSRYFDCPEELQPIIGGFNWAGWTELRKISFDQLEETIDFYLQEIEEMGKWRFASLYVPMTTEQREECLRRSGKK